MNEGEEARKAKWEQPEIEDPEPVNEAKVLDQERNDKKKYGVYHPMGGGWHMVGMCSPRRPCYPSGSWQCAPRQACAPYFALQLMNPYCRPNGFNYGYGCFPRR